MSFGKVQSAPKNALLVCGEPGTGKTEWIRTQAKLKKANLFRWNTRIDRSLREGREILHQQVRAREPMFVWLEGCDDLTQEAQGFLRRILETASANITCILEVREPWKLSPPILSRCTIVHMPTNESYRKKHNTELATRLGLLVSKPSLPATVCLRDIPSYRKQGLDPQDILQWCVDTYGWEDVELQKCVREIGNGSTIWAEVSYFLSVKETAVPDCV
jgi:DNA polymerase III delta prime subunit